MLVEGDKEEVFAPCVEEAVGLYKPSHTRNRIMALPLFGSSSFGLLAIGVLLLSFSLYRYLLPKPIPGIPYNKHAARRLLGDMPEFGKSVSETKEVNKWLVDQCRAHNSAICQVFVRPFAKPVSN